MSDAGDDPRASAPTAVAAMRASQLQVSVIVPTRNARAYVADAVRSVLDQPGVELEVIVIDDGSTDGSADVVRALNDPRVRIIPGPRAGISAAMNAGIEAARGQYLARCDADDLYPRGRLTRQLAWLAANPDVEASFLPGAFVANRGIYGGQKYGLPMYAQTMRLYYNRRLFTEAGLDPARPPATHSEMRAFAKQITESSGGAAYGLILGDKFPWVWWMNAAVPAMGTGSYYFDWSTGRYNYNAPGIKQALQLMIDMQTDGSITPGIHTLTDDDARQQFSFGAAGMIIGGSWNAGVFNDQFQSTEDWETAELPAPDGGLVGKFQQGIGDRYTVSAASQNKEAAWQVMKFFYSVPTMTAMYEKGMGVMAVAAANTGVSSVKGVPLLAPTPNDVIVPPEPELPTMTPDYQTIFQQAFDEGGATLDALLTDVTNRYNAALDEAIAAGTLVASDYVVADWPSQSAATPTA